MEENIMKWFDEFISAAEELEWQGEIAGRYA